MAGERGRSWWQRLPSLVQVLAIVGAAAAFVLVWWLVPLLLYAGVAAQDVRIQAITNTRTALLAGLVGLGALGTFWLNSRIYRITARTFEVTERGHVTDRYSKGIEQLGSDSLDVRLGGIYALEQIAKDSARIEEDQATIVEVLSAFVRVHSDPVYQYKAAQPAGWSAPMGNDQEAAALAATVADYVKNRKPPVDVQAAVTVLGRLRHLEMVPRADLTGATLRHVTLHTDLTGAALARADLTGADLTGADLTGADLTGADLTGADLTGADLTGADLTGAELIEAKLIEAVLTGADLTGADLTKANLTKAALTKAQHLFDANLTEAVLREADLTRANLHGAYLGGADLTSAALFDADLTGANLTNVNLTSAVLFGADLTGADLTKANLAKAALQDANLTRANLTGANLAGANLSKVRLNGSDLSGAILSASAVHGISPDKAREISVRGLTQAQLNGALGDHETRLPARLRRPETWDVREAAEAD